MSLIYVHKKDFPTYTLSGKKHTTIRKNVMHVNNNIQEYYFYYLAIQEYFKKSTHLLQSLELHRR